MIELHSLYKCQISAVLPSVFFCKTIKNEKYWSHRKNEMSFRVSLTVLILAIFTPGKNISRLSQLLQATHSFKYFPFLLNNGKHIPFYCWTSWVLSLCKDQNLWIVLRVYIVYGKKWFKFASSISKIVGVGFFETPQIRSFFLKIG